MNSSLLHVILTIFVLSYLYAAWVFVMKQRQGASFVTAFDSAMIKGGYFLVFGSALSFLVVAYGDLPLGFA